MERRIDPFEFSSAALGPVVEDITILQCHVKFITLFSAHE